jgi:hypothetical protein
MTNRKTKTTEDIWNENLDKKALDEIRAEAESLNMLAARHHANQVNAVSDYDLGLMEGLRRGRKIASHFSIKEDASIYPGTLLKNMNETVQVVCHTTAQQIAMDIAEELEKVEKS